jgi:hypothetical protein
MSKIKLEKLTEQLPSKFKFICFASYEERSVKCAKSINSSSIDDCVIFRSIEHKSLPSAQQIKEYIPQGREIPLKLSDFSKTAYTITQTVEELFENPDDCSTLIIDVTTFTHECLLIALRAVHLQNQQKQKFTNIYCVYTSAEKYSSWLSKGCKDVRNVYGFPGFFKPQKKNALILLAGYEIERATRTIELLEPDILFLGIGKNPTHENNTEDMKAYAEKITNWVKCRQENNSTFEFSCDDIEDAYKTLKTEIQNKKQDYNIIIVPLNTKLSTIATLLVALDEKDIQVCYSVPEFYNEEDYSTPDVYVTLVEMNKIGTFGQ